MRTKIMRDASYLLPEPGGEVVRQCLDEIERLQAILQPDGVDAKALLTHAVFGMFAICGNSYANAYITEWLEQAKKLGAYKGKTVGNINDLRDEFNEWLDENGGLPPLANQQGGAKQCEKCGNRRK